MDGINNAQTGASRAGATVADLGANAPQWYHSVATPRNAGTNTGNNNAVSAWRGAGGAVEAANHAQAVTPGTANTVGNTGGAAGEALHPTNSRRRTAELGTANRTKTSNCSVRQEAQEVGIQLAARPWGQQQQ